MKIVILSMYSGLINRGVETWTREIAKRLSQKGHAVTVFQGGDEESQGYKKIVIRQNIFWSLRKIGNFLQRLVAHIYWNFVVLSFTFRTIPRIVQIKPDIVVPTNGGLQTFLMRLITKLTGSKMIVVGHAGIGAPDKWNLLARPDYFVGLSKRGVKWAKNLFLSKGVSITYIPNGVDLDKFSPNVKKIKLSLEKPIVLVVSSFEKYKRVDLVIKAVSRLKDVNLLVLGGDRESGVDQLGKDLLGARYKLLKVNPSDIPSYYASSDVFSLVSDESEAFGIVYLEAMASNLAVVGTNDELRREIVGNAGILINPTDINSYAKALQKAIHINWGNKPRIQAEKFSWDGVCSQYENLFSQLLK